MPAALFGSASEAQDPARLPRGRAGPRVRALFAVLMVLMVVLVAAGGLLYVTLPSVGDAEQRVAAVLRAHGGEPTSLRLPRRVSVAVVAVEDERFWHHGAVDPLAIGRVLLNSVAHPGRDAGGSTLAQQLAKVLYLDGKTGALAQLRAVGLAFKLEDRYSKTRILAMYLDSVYFGHGHWGIARASRGYFATPPDHLSWGEATLLAGLPQAPSADDPVLHFARARARQREVLHQLVANHELTSAQAAAAYRHTPRPT